MIKQEQLQEISNETGLSLEQIQDKEALGDIIVFKTLDNAYHFCYECGNWKIRDLKNLIERLISIEKKDLEHYENNVSIKEHLVLSHDKILALSDGAYAYINC